jgi:predicted MFS family arabinose efflux permease
MTKPLMAAREPHVSAGTILLLAASCGVIVANMYYAQPLVGPIAASLDLAPRAAGLVVTMSQLGYGAGLVFIAPLGDLVENRRLALACVAFTAVALAAAAAATSAAAFLVAAAAIGLGAVGAQILVPLAAHLSPEATRGRAVGAVMGGLMFGIMAARPFASFIASEFSWRVVFVVSAALMAALGLLLSRALPVRRPQVRTSYLSLIGSMARLAAATPILRLRAFYQSCLFAAFSLFWTTAPLLLASPAYRLTQRGIALFALASVSGAVAAPIAGRLADRGYGEPATGAAIGAVALAFLLTMVAGQGSPLALALLVGAALAVDFGVQANVVLGMRSIFLLAPEARGRLNGVYIATFFLAGALGSAIGAWAFAKGGWTLASWIGLGLPLVALARYFYRQAVNQT